MTRSHRPIARKASKVESAVAIDMRTHSVSALARNFTNPKTAVTRFSRVLVSPSMIYDRKATSQSPEPGFGSTSSLCLQHRTLVRKNVSTELKCVKKINVSND
jgi:hypothetical protein